MSDDVNRQVLLAERPKGKLEEAHFTRRDVPIPEPGDGEALTRTLYISLDAANRAWMSPVATYTNPVEIGGVMDGFTLAQVVRSNDSSLAPGDIVESMNGWQDYGVAPARHLHKVAPIEPLSHLLSGVGVTGKTAYFGLLDVGQPKPGETVLVSAAAGAVGSFVGQIAKLKGCRAVGIAGTDEKCRWLTEELGFDAAINYKTEDMNPALRAACPDGIDVYFDNVGGPILEAALFQTNQNGRVVCCGSVSQYDTATPDPGPRGVPGLLVVKRIRMQGFIVMDFYDRRRQAEAELAAWIGDGRIKVREDIIDGLENAPAALVGLLAGENTGKRMVRVAPEPS
ncbi:MAG: NADP-dependent oxidoreductase [Minwuiales bacterium]|nr:NADP-dependent oxidoreductase [Minwuiales bacterium]